MTPCLISSSSSSLKSFKEIANISAYMVSFTATIIIILYFNHSLTTFKLRLTMPVSVPHNKTFLLWINSHEVISARTSGLYSNLSWRPTSPFFEFCNGANLNNDIDHESYQK